MGTERAMKIILSCSSVGVLLLVPMAVGCGKKTATEPMAAPTSTQPTVIAPEAVANDVPPEGKDADIANWRLPVNLTAEDFAFIPVKNGYPDRFCESDPRLRKTFNEKDGAEFQVEDAIEKTCVVFRKRLVGDFRIEIDLDFSSRQSDYPGYEPSSRDASRGPNTGSSGTSRTKAISTGRDFSTHFRNGALRLGFHVPEAVTSVARSNRFSSGGEVTDGDLMVIERKDGQIHSRFRGNNSQLTTPQPDPGYLVFTLTPDAKFRIRNLKLTGESDKIGFEMPAMVPAEMNQAAWKKAASPPRTGKVEEVQTDFANEGMTLENKMERGIAHAIYAQQFDGDFYVEARVRLLAAGSPTGNRTNRVFSFGVTRADGPTMNAMPVSWRNESADSWLTISRSGSTITATTDGKAEVWESQKGPVAFELQSRKPNLPVFVDQMKVYSESSSARAGAAVQAIGL